MAVHMFNKQNKTSLSEYWNGYRNGQGCSGTRLRLVPLQPWPLRYENDVLLDSLLFRWNDRYNINIIFINFINFIDLLFYHFYQF